MLGVWGDYRKECYKVSIEKNIYLYIFDFFICIVSVHLVVSLKLRSLLYCVASVCIASTSGKEKDFKLCSLLYLFALSLYT